MRHLYEAPHPSPKPGNLFLDVVKSVFGESHFLSTWSVLSMVTAQRRPLQAASPMFLPPTPAALL